MFGVFAVGALGDEDVSGFHVPVDQAVGVGGVERGGDLAGDPGGRLHGQRAGAVEQGPQVLSGDVAHGDVEDAVRLAGLEDGHDVRVVDGGGDLRLVGEALPEGVVAGELGGQQFQGDGPVQAQVPGPVDDGHAAAPDHVPDEVAGEPGAGQFRGPPGGWRGVRHGLPPPSGRSATRVGSCGASRTPATAPAPDSSGSGSGSGAGSGGGAGSAAGGAPGSETTA